MQLDPAAVAAGARLIEHDAIGSTNAEALRLGGEGEHGPLWITARAQTAGRGRRGRAWVSEAGNLYTTLLLSDPSEPRHFPELSFVAALALHDAVVGRVAGLASRVGLKWPNDLLIDRNKFAGILVEGEGACVVIGIGVNCAHHPAGTDQPATDLATAGLRVTPDSLFPQLSAAMTVRLTQWGRGTGFSSIRAEWMVRALGMGRTVRIKTGAGESSGIFDRIDDSGRLVLRAPDGTMQAMAAGDVLIGPRQ